MCILPSQVRFMSSISGHFWWSVHHANILSTFQYSLQYCCPDYEFEGVAATFVLRKLCATSCPRKPRIRAVPNVWFGKWIRVGAIMGSDAVQACVLRHALTATAVGKISLITMSPFYRNRVCGWLQNNDRCNGTPLLRWLKSISTETSSLRYHGNTFHPFTGPERSL